MTEGRRISLRPHHLDNLIDWFARRKRSNYGYVYYSDTFFLMYGEKFVRNLDSLFTLIASGDNVNVLIRNKVDDICKECHIRKRETCYLPDDLELDLEYVRIMHKLDLKVGSTYSSKELLRRIKRNYPKYFD